jgi:hypothetical protein
MLKKAIGAMDDMWLLPKERPSSLNSGKCEMKNAGSAVKSLLSSDMSEAQAQKGLGGVLVSPRLRQPICSSMQIQPGGHASTDTRQQRPHQASHEYDNNRSYDYDNNRRMAAVVSY